MSFPGIDVGEVYVSIKLTLHKLTNDQKERVRYLLAQTYGSINVEWANHDRSAITVAVRSSRGTPSTLRTTVLSILNNDRLLNGVAIVDRG